LEDTEEQFASVFDSASVGSSVLNMPVDALVGHVVRLFRGKGAGQERAVTSNTATTLFVTPAWEIEPDESSIFVVSDNTWHFGGRARTSPARFLIPNRQDKVVQITGRSANAQNVESLEGLAIVTRWRIGGGGLGVADLDVPPEPSFSAAAPGDGALVLTSIGFPVLENTQTISTGTFQLWFRDELAAPGTISLASAILETDTTATLNAAGPAQAGDLIQIEGEVLRVIDVQGAGTQYEVARGQCGSSAAPHTSGTLVHQLQLRSVIVPFPRSFFGTLASGGWAHSEPLPSLRLVCAELWLANAFGQSPVGANSYASLPDGGLRTLQGGQFNFQVEDY
jgi:hypothetical protein